MKICSCGRGPITSVKNYRCRECNRERMRVRYKANPEKMREISYSYRTRNPEKYRAQNARYRLKLKVEVMTHYAKGKPVCHCCGEVEVRFLGIDHLDNDGAAERRITGGGHSAYRWLKTNGYPNRNYTISCQNCNSARYYYSICPHKMVIAEDPIQYLGEHL